ncbi:MAG: MFS transporter, partial [Clostridia bacterium]|nr:MFS transporter [Clostridia bacterium]
IHFGKRASQEIIGIQMASAYVGTTVMPPLFGLIAQHISIRLWPAYLLALLVLMFAMYEQVRRKTSRS